MKKISIILLFLSIVVFIGCGGGNHQNGNQENASMQQRFNYFQNGELVSGNNTTCHQNLLYGDSYIIHSTISHSNENIGSIYFSIERYRKMDCKESVGWSTSTYNYTLDSNSTEDNKLKIKLTNTSFNEDKRDFEIEGMLSNIIFGTHILGNPYYTTVVGSGDIRKDKIQLGFAYPTVGHDGSTPDKRAIDTSNYIEKKYYIKEPKDN